MSIILDPETVKNKSEKIFDVIFHHAPCEPKNLYICLVCDEFEKLKEVHILSLEEFEKMQHILTSSTWNAVARPIVTKYEYIKDIRDNSNEKTHNWIANMLLSLRAYYLKKEFGFHKGSFAMCSQYKMSSQKKNMMLHFGIANNIAFEYMKNYIFTSHRIVVTAMLGVAATELLMGPVRSALQLNQKKLIQPEQVAVWQESKFLIIDKNSFADKRDIKKLIKQLQKCKQPLEMPHKGLNIIFSGDMQQLEPIEKDKNTVYKENCCEFEDWVYVEQEDFHCSEDDKSWDRLLLRIRNGNMTLTDMKEINKRVVFCDTELPSDICYVTYHNHDRDAIKTALFEKTLQRCFANKRK